MRRGSETESRALCGGAWDEGQENRSAPMRRWPRAQVRGGRPRRRASASWFFSARPSGGTLAAVAAEVAEVEVAEYAPTLQFDEYAIGIHLLRIFLTIAFAVLGGMQAAVAETTTVVPGYVFRSSSSSSAPGSGTCRSASSDVKCGGVPPSGGGVKLRGSPIVRTVTEPDAAGLGDRVTSPMRRGLGRQLRVARPRCGGGLERKCEADVPGGGTPPRVLAERLS